MIGDRSTEVTCSSAALSEIRSCSTSITRPFTPFLPQIPFWPPLISRRRCRVFEPSPAVQCHLVEKHTNGVVHLHGVVVATRHVAGQFRLHVIKTGPGGTANLNQAGTFSASPNRDLTLGQITVSVEPGAQFTASLVLEAGGRSYK